MRTPIPLNVLPFHIFSIFQGLKYCFEVKEIKFQRTDLEFGHNHEKFGVSLVTPDVVKNLLAIQDTGRLNPWVQKIPLD